MKTVKYKGQSFEVPDYAKFIAADADGKVWVYSQCPSPNGNGEQYVAHLGCNVEKVGTLKGTLKKVKEI